MENKFKNSEIEVITAKYAESEGGSGKYLNKHIAPGHMYVIEGDNNLVGSCLYNIDKPMMVITYKSYEQFLKDATKSELEAKLSGSEKASCNISDEIIANKQLELVDKPIKYKTSIQILNDMDLFTFGSQMKGHKVILIDDYQSIVEDWYQEWPQKPTALQRLSIEYGITVIASKCPLAAKVDDPVEMADPVLWMTDKYSMENRFETAEINIVRMSFGVNDDLGTALKRSLAPSQLYIIDKTPEIATSFYYGLDEPSVVFTLTKSSTQFIKDLMWSRAEAGYLTGVFDLDDIGKTINIMENRPMWIDDSKIHSVEELYEKCLQMKEERNIQFVVIDDFQRLAPPNSDEILWQLCKIAKKFDIVLVGMKRATCNDTDEHHQPRRRRKRNQAKGLDAILRTDYAG